MSRLRQGATTISVQVGLMWVMSSTCRGVRVGLRLVALCPLGEGSKYVASIALSAQGVIMSPETLSWGLYFPVRLLWTSEYIILNCIVPRTYYLISNLGGVAPWPNLPRSSSLYTNMNFYIIFHSLVYLQRVLTIVRIGLHKVNVVSYSSTGPTNYVGLLPTTLFYL